MLAHKLIHGASHPWVIPLGTVGRLEGSHASHAGSPTRPSLHLKSPSSVEHSYVYSAFGGSFASIKILLVQLHVEKLLHKQANNVVKSF